MSRDTLLIVDDEADLLTGLARAIGMEIDCRILTATGGREALEIMADHPVDVVLADIRMPEMDGLELLARIKEQDPAITVIIMTAYGTIQKAVEAIKNGAYDFIQKPVDEDRLIHLIRNGLDRNRLVRENTRLKAEMDSGGVLCEMVGRSRPMQAVFQRIRMLAGSDVTVLIQGETGTGKDLAARAIHNLSGRSRREMVTVNCPALPETILESELFGYRKGAFTNADTDHEGLFDRADGGAIFLDEIGDLSPAVQAKLLRVLQEKEIKPLGAAGSHIVDVRIIAATNRDLQERIREKRFREDLYYRLNVAGITMPSLGDIREDIPLLVDHFLEKIARETGDPKKRVSAAVMDGLLARPWPGNIRELENRIRGWVAMTPGRVIRSEPAPDGTAPPAASEPVFDPERSYQQLKDRAVEGFTQEYLDGLLRHVAGNISQAARISGMKRQTLQKIIKRHDIDVDRYRS
jgi:DNA-binding NtrC family response regulator